MAPTFGWSCTSCGAHGKLPTMAFGPFIGEEVRIAYQAHDKVEQLCREKGSLSIFANAIPRPQRGVGVRG